MISEHDKENTITEDMYKEMCDDISQELGQVSHIQFIGALNRIHSHLSLWKATYTSSDNEVFWGISFDRETHKVKDIHIDW